LVKQRHLARRIAVVHECEPVVETRANVFQANLDPLRVSR